MTRTIVLACVAVCGVSFLAIADAAGANRRPNFVVIMADDMGYGDASCYGRTDYQTPRLNQLADEGLRFTDFHSNGPVCSPTRAALLTGRYQQRSGIDGVVYAGFDQNRHHGLFPSETTFAEVLKEAGYATGMFGKWHLGYQRRYNPIHHGFDRFRGYVSGNICYAAHLDRMGVLDWWDGLEVKDEPGYSTHLITRHAVEFIREHQDEPFCVYIAHEAVHTPWQGPNDPPMRTLGRQSADHYTWEVDKQKAYREMLIELDRGVGEVIDTLRELDIDDDTLVFFFSDNGAISVGSNGPLNGFKGSLWEGGMREPCIAWWPGVIAPGRETAETAMTMDIMPTLIELAGLKSPDGCTFDGVSLADLLLEDKPLPNRKLYWEYTGQRAMRDGPWKLLQLASKPPKAPTAPMLFHLGDDLGETRDLAAKHPERVERMMAEWAAWYDDVKDGATAQPETPLPE